MRGSLRAVVVCGALIAAGLGAAGPAAASTAVPACSVTWVGNSEEWNNPVNWSTGQVPGPNSDVCISGDGPAPEAGGPIDIHSLQVSDGADPLFENLTISDILTISGAGLFFGGTLSAPTIDNAGLIQAVNASEFLPPSVILVAPTSRSVRPASFRPQIDLLGQTTRVLVEQIGAVDAGRLWELVGRVRPQQQWGIDEALMTVLGLR